ncbi:hypothetical protein Patl1_28596 [Pistacia atlantica]|uniref:Uncharacterized protein n=1 Tax=Pistacia atlantica TaxID=434234 RepID=A0ACC1BEB9_9ROSI|nr:hypothetical protein Patl1_28596 [Pistacia atlantica]
MKILKGYVKNRARPEGCAAECYLVDETVTFCSGYFKYDFGGNDQNARNQDFFSDVILEGHPILGGKSMSLSDEVLELAHHYVLFNTTAPPRGYYELEMYNEDEDLTSRLEYVTTRNMNIYDDSEEVSYVREDCEGIEAKISQPIDEEYVKLSSFLGPLRREIVPFTIPDWRKLSSDMREKLWKCVQEMGALWRTSKSRLVSNIKMVKNEEERMALKLDNIKSISEWKKFMEEKLGPKFKGKSEEMKNKRKKQTSYTGGQRGYALMTEDIIEAHKKKNGEPINTKTEEAIEKLQQMGNDSSLPTPTNLRENAITKGQRQTVEESEDVSIVKTIPHKTKCKLLDWNGSTEVVAEGRFLSDDPKALVHYVLIRPNAMRVWIDIAKVPNAFLWRFASEMVFVEDVG